MEKFSNFSEQNFNFIWIYFNIYIFGNIPKYPEKKTGDTNEGNIIWGLFGLPDIFWLGTDWLITLKPQNGNLYFSYIKYYHSNIGEHAKLMKF